MNSHVCREHYAGPIRQGFMIPTPPPISVHEQTCPPVVLFSEKPPSPPMTVQQSIHFAAGGEKDSQLWEGPHSQKPPMNKALKMKTV